MWNTFKTTILLTLLTVLFIYVGALLGGQGGMFIAFLLACVMNFVSYWFSDKIILRMYRAQEVSEANQPELFASVRELCAVAELPMPKIYIIDEPSPNAFATGRNPEHAAVAVTTGILRLLKPDELKGVIGHELAHVKHRDTLIATIAATFAGAISMLAMMARWSFFFLPSGSRDSDDRGPNPIVLLLVSLIAGFAAMLIQMAISRSREFMADRDGAIFNGNPKPLAEALRKLQMGVAQVPKDDASPATAHLFIVSPFSSGGGALGFVGKLFSTHPPVDERIRRLLSYSR